MTITVSNELDTNRLATVIIDKACFDEVEETVTEYINEQEAMALICSLVKVFQIPNSDIEVIHFPAGANKAECLRNAADRLDREGETEVSCPPEYAASNWGLDCLSQDEQDVAANLSIRAQAETEVLASIDSCEAKWESENGA